jgi:cytoskeletal protein CcmA (bactofilin family)
MTTTAHIGASIHIKGEITAHEPLTIAGQVEGTIDVSGHPLVVTEGGRIKADVVAHSIEVGGIVTGSLTADGRIVVLKSATIEGDLSAPSVVIDDGAQLQGRFEIVGKRRAELLLAS